MEVVGTSPHSKSARVGMPKQLNFDDTGDSTLNGTSNLVLESDQVIKSLDLNANKGLDYDFEKDHEKLEVVKSVTSIPETSNVSANECSGPAISADN